MLDGNPMLCLATRQALGRFREEGSRLHLLLIWACMQALGRFHKEDSRPISAYAKALRWKWLFLTGNPARSCKETDILYSSAAERHRPTSAEAEGASANVGEVGEMDIGQRRRRPMKQKKGRPEADPTS